MKPEFKHPELYQVLPFREWLRKNMPGGADGFIVEDLDLVIRWYGRHYGFDSHGAFILIDLKFGNTDLSIAQKKTFSMMDKLLRLADPHYERYLGFYVLQYSNENWDVANFRINFQNVTHQQFMEFWQRRFIVPSYVFPV